MKYDFTYNGTLYNFTDIDGRYHLEEASSSYRPEGSERNIFIEFLSANGYNKDDLLKMKKTTYGYRSMALEVFKTSKNVKKVIKGDAAVTSDSIHINKLFDFNNKYSLSTYLANKQRIQEALDKGTITNSDVKRFALINAEYDNVVKTIKTVGTQISKIFVDKYGSELLVDKARVQLYDSGAHLPAPHCRIRDYIWLALYDKQHNNGNFSVSVYIKNNKMSLKIMPNNNAKNPKTQWQYNIYEELSKTQKNEYEIIYDALDNSDYYFKEISKGAEIIAPFYKQLYKQIDADSRSFSPISTNNNKEEIQNDNNEIKAGLDEDLKLDLNMILYGPPGTGKTYNTKIYAVAIAENMTLKDARNLDYETEIVPKFNKLVEEKRIAFTTFHQSYGYEQFIEGIAPKLEGNTNNIEYEIRDGIFKEFCNEENETLENQNHSSTFNKVFIIDEINRGKISKIFGELITLIEPEKRLGNAEAQTAVLPYSKKPFGVPNNIYILGTMNTADRSIAIMDTALRRRFHFIEMMPDSSVIKGVTVNGLDVQTILDTINSRIEVLYDRDHTIGHAYFNCLKGNPTIEQLSKVFKNKVIPLLQEYFYEDYEKIRLILGDNSKEEKYQFIKQIKNDASLLFKGKIDEDDIPEYAYSLNEDAFNDIESYRLIIED